jgi:heat shock protein HspQ
MKFEIGDLVEHAATPGVQRMVVDLDPGEPSSTPHPSVVMAWRDHRGKTHECVVEARFTRLIYRAVPGGPVRR